MEDSRGQWFNPNSADAQLAGTLKDGDVILMNRTCRSLGPVQALLCMMSKFGLSGDGKAAWDHAAIVVQDQSSKVPYLLEGCEKGVTLRTFEERLVQDADHQEMLLVPLRGLPNDAAAVDQRRTALQGFIAELSLRKTADGFEAYGTRCANTWALYRELRAGPRQSRAPALMDSPQVTDDGAPTPPCQFGAPLVATALQRLGVVDPRINPAAITPRVLLKLPLVDPDACFGKPVSVRSASDTII